jgi:crotonobetainyl-CoA:carnitine CoA-transferase CaiB-like acyl-CoA transferase
MVYRFLIENAKMHQMILISLFTVKSSCCMFDGLKVIELASVLAGPSVGQFFAELGADVIKIENGKGGGDVTRTWRVSGESADDRSAYFCSCNWGKRSVALDLESEKGKSAIQKMASRCDVVIASYKLGDAEKLGVSYKQLAAKQPQLIYGQVSGYGQDNDRVGYDAVIQAESGFMDLNGELDRLPLKMPVALIDLIAAHQLKEGLLLALLKKEKTGKGSLVEVSLIQSAIASLANQATNWLVAKKLPTRKGSAHPNIAPYGEAFETADGKRILLAVGNDKQFQNLCTVLKIKSGSDFATNDLRVSNRAGLTDLLLGEIKKWKSNDLLSMLHTNKIPGGAIQTVSEALAMDAALQLVLEASGLKGIRNFVARSSSWKTESLLPPPHFGEHTAEVLKDLGI